MYACYEHDNNNKQIKNNLFAKQTWQQLNKKHPLGHD